MGNISKEIQSTFPSENAKALVHIKYTANWIANKTSAILNPFDISMQQYNILRISEGRKRSNTRSDCQRPDGRKIAKHNALGRQALPQGFCLSAPL